MFNLQEKKDKFLQIRISESEKAAIEEMAAERGLKVSEFIMVILKAEYEKKLTV